MGKSTKSRVGRISQIGGGRWGKYNSRGWCREVAGGREVGGRGKPI